MLIVPAREGGSVSGNDLVIEGATVVPVDAGRQVLENAHVAIEAGVITSVGVGPAPVGAPGKRITGKGLLVIPGFINTHQHHWYNFFKGLGEGMLLERWISDLLVPAGKEMTPADMGVASTLSTLEMLRSGTTNSINHMVTTTTPEHVESILDSVVASGMRQSFAKEVRAWDLADQLALAEEMHRRWEGRSDGRIKVSFAIESTAHWVLLGTSSAELIVQGTEMAQRLGTVVTGHVAGGTMSREYGYLKFMLETGRTDIEYLHSLGVLSPTWVLAHAIHVRDRDIELIAASGASVSHTPTSESTRAGGITPVRRMMNAGVNVALGTDGPMVDTSVDMVEQMKSVRLFQNQLHLDPLAIDPWTALEMATIRAARCIGVGDQLGSLEVGKRGDLVAFDIDTPWASVGHGAVGTLVHSVRGLDARHVAVDGELLVEDGRYTRWTDDGIAELLEEARGRSAAAASRAGLLGG